MGRRKPSEVSVWYGLSDSQIDPRAHFWHEGAQGIKHRLCDNTVSSGPIQEPPPKNPLLPCPDCEQLYVQDMTYGKRVFNYLPLPSIKTPALGPDFMVYYSKFGASYPKNGVHSVLENPTIGMATFARFYNAPASARERIVREARTFLIDPKGYPARSYYWALLNTFKQTHWNTHDVTDFETAFPAMIEKLPEKKGKESRKDHYQKIGKAYLEFWSSQQDPQFFKVPPTRIEIHGLNILVNPEVGLKRYGDELALKLWLAAQGPNLAYRQAIQYLMTEAQNQGWEQHLQPAIWDVRRKQILPNVRLARGFERVIRSQAAAFRVHWDDLGTEDEG